MCDAYGEGWHRAYTMMALGVEVWRQGDVHRAAGLEKESLSLQPIARRSAGGRGQPRGAGLDRRHGGALPACRPAAGNPADDLAGDRRAAVRVRAPGPVPRRMRVPHAPRPSVRRPSAPPSRMAPGSPTTRRSATRSERTCPRDGQPGRGERPSPLTRSGDGDRPAGRAGAEQQGDRGNAGDRPAHRRGPHRAHPEQARLPPPAPRSPSGSAIEPEPRTGKFEAGSFAPRELPRLPAGPSSS